MEPRIIEAGEFGDVGERSVTIVMVKAVSGAVKSHEQVFITVVVIIAGTNTVSPSGPAQARVGCNIAEGAVAIVVVKVVCGRAAFGGALQRAAIQNKQVWITIVIVVNRSNPATRTLP